MYLFNVSQSTVDIAQQSFSCSNLTLLCKHSLLQSC